LQKLSEIAPAFWSAPALRRFCSVERAVGLQKETSFTFCPSVSWIKGELLQKVTKETKMFESLRKELVECRQRCHVDSNAGEKRWSTTALQDASRRRKLSERVRV
jgi:hypothetical protein